MSIRTLRMLVCGLFLSGTLADLASAQDGSCGFGVEVYGIDGLCARDKGDAEKLSMWLRGGAEFQAEDVISKIPICVLNRLDASVLSDAGYKIIGKTLRQRMFDALRSKECDLVVLNENALKAITPTQFRSTPDSAAEAREREAAKTAAAEAREREAAKTAAAEAREREAAKTALAEARKPQPVDGINWWLLVVIMVGALGAYFLLSRRDDRIANGKDRYANFRFEIVRDSAPKISAINSNFPDVRIQIELDTGPPKVTVASA